MQPVLHFVVNNQIITRTDTFVPVRNSRNYLYAEFEFKTEDWAGVSKIALFHNEGNEQISILLGETNTCLIPAEVLTSTSFTVSVVASDMITANAVTIKLYESGYRQGDIPEPPPSLYEQIMNYFDETKATTTGAAKEAESWAHGHADYPDRQKDNAAYYASEAKNAAEKASESVRTAATQAISDISTAKSEATQAVTSEGAKQLKSVTTAGEEKVTSMTQINTEFDTKSSQALNDLQTEKDTAVKNIKELATEKTDEINTAGTSQKNAVNTAGDTKVKAVTDEGNKQKTAIQEVAEPFLSDINRINTMFNLLAYTDKVYSIDIPLWERTQGSAGIKSDDNAGLIALPSTAAEHRQNDYEELPWFKTIDVNAIVDDNGIKKITAVKGDDNFSETGSVDVFVCGLAFYEKWSDLGNGYMRYSRCFTPREGYELNKLAYNLDSTKNPFFLIAKYPLVKGEDGLLHSQPNKICAFRTSDSAT